MRALPGSLTGGAGPTCMSLHIITLATRQLTIAILSNGISM